MADKPRVLVVDDKASMRDMLSMALSAKGMEVTQAENGQKALELAGKTPFDAIVSDLKMPKLDGLGLLRALSEKGEPPPFIMITAHGSVKDAVEAMSLGAADFMEKPFELAEFEFKVERALDEARTTGAPPKAAGEEALPGLIGSSPQLLEVADIVKRAARSTVPVLILGESGTGKELVARAVHERSPRADQAFVAVHAGALAPGVLESELFGHEKGAFTGADSQRKGRFETADGGSLFLDELGEIPQTTQVKLLRVLQDKTFERVGGSAQLRTDVRLVCATNRNLREMVKEGGFREDLFYRVNVVTVTMPPLRERSGDIAKLVAHFLKKEGSKLAVPEEVMARLQAYHWPGNVRELENVIRRCIALATGDAMRVEDLPPEMLEATRLPPGEDAPQGLVGDLERIERNTLLNALEETAWNVSRAARILGVGRTALQYKMKKYGLKKPA
ncbi:MAG: sigma-54-dependent Fis family transcriptional regulator [Planctomycetes bacterium]|nr:sigma-54-dependent Fis family transcriptional regulator [Planctomycetota bacterium]